MTPAQVIARLEEIEADLAARLKKGEDAAASHARAKRDWEKAYAVEYLKQQGTVEERRNRTIVALWRSPDYKRLVEAEAAYEGFKAASRVLETRASIGQSLLRAYSQGVA